MRRFMKTILKLISLFFAAGVPAAFAAELAGVSLPPVIDALHIFSGFAAAMALMVVFADYQRASPGRYAAASRRSVRASAKAVYPLAA
jgi:hypothetical protein